MGELQPTSPQAPTNLECSSTQAPYSARRIDHCHKNSFQIIATVQPSVWARTLLNVCRIGCDIFGLDKNAQSTWASVRFHSNCARNSKKQARRIFFFQTFFLSNTVLVGCSCCWFIHLFRVVSSFDVRCYFLLLWCRWQDVKEFVHFPLGLALGEGLSMLFVVHVGITVHDPHMHIVLKLSGHGMLCDWCDCLKLCKIPSSSTTFKGTPKIVVKQHWCITSSNLHCNVFDLI